MKFNSYALGYIILGTACAAGALRHVGAGNHHSVFLDAESGVVWTAGEDLLGQLGQGDGTGFAKDNPRAHRVDPVWSGKVIDVTSGLNTCAVVTESGEVWTWGFNKLGQLGHSTDVDFSGVPGMVAGLPPIADIAGGSGFFLALTTEGDLYAWGNNSVGQLGLGVGAPGKVKSPSKVALPDGVKVVDMATGINQVLALTDDGRVFGWGSNRNRQAGGAADERSVEAPRLLEGLPEGHKVAAVGVGNYSSYAILEDGRIFGFGENQFGQIPGAEGRRVFPPVEVALPEGAGRPVAISGGARYVHALTEDGSLFVWGVNGPQGQFGDGTMSRDISVFAPPMRVEGVPALAEISTQTNHTVARGKDGRYYGWGSNGQGRLAQDIRDDSGKLQTAFPTPVEVELHSGK